MRVIAYAAAGVIPLVGLAAMAAAGPEAAECAAVQVRTAATGTSTLVTVSDRGVPMSIRVLPRRINAIGRDDDNQLYGIAQPVGARAQFVRISEDGRLTVLGVAQGLGDVFVGTAHAGSLLLLSGNSLVTVRIAGLVRAAPVPLSVPVSIGDWAFDAGRGALLALSTHSDRPALIAVDPKLGTVTTLGFPARLPRGSYGGIWLDHGALFALHNESGATYRVPLDGHAATLVAAGAPVTAVDAASCAALPAPPASPSPSLSPVVRPTQSPSPVTPSDSPSPAPSPIPPTSPPPASPSVIVVVPPKPPRVVPPPRVRRPHLHPPQAAAPPALPPVPPPAPPRPVPPPRPPKVVVPPLPVATTPQRVSPIVANGKAHAQDRERSRRRVAVAAAVMTLGAVLARSRTRTR